MLDYAYVHDLQMPDACLTPGVLQLDSSSSGGWYSHCIPLVMTLFYFNTMFLFIMFLVYSSSIFDIFMIDNEFMYKIVKCLI
jgi:hypothetical protein